MVRSQTTRRTRTDLRYLADAVDRSVVDPAIADDPERNARLIDHGWLTSQGRLTGDGDRLARVAHLLDRREVLDLTIDVVGGLSAFVDVTTAAKPEGVIEYFAAIRTLANVTDEARHKAGTQSIEYDHDGTFAPHFADFDPRRGTVEMRFKSKATANEFVDNWCPDRYEVERKHDERFGGNRNPKRLIVTVV